MSSTSDTHRLTLYGASHPQPPPSFDHRQALETIILDGDYLLMEPAAKRTSHQPTSAYESRLRMVGTHALRGRRDPKTQTLSDPHFHPHERRVAELCRSFGASATYQRLYQADESRQNEETCALAPEHKDMIRQTLLYTLSESISINFEFVPPQDSVLKSLMCRFGNDNWDFTWESTLRTLIRKTPPTPPDQGGHAYLSKGRGPVRSRKSPEKAPATDNTHELEIRHSMRSIFIPLTRALRVCNVDTPYLAHEILQRHIRTLRVVPVRVDVRMQLYAAATLLALKYNEDHDWTVEEISLQVLRHLQQYHVHTKRIASPASRSGILQMERRILASLQWRLHQIRLPLVTCFALLVEFLHSFVLSSLHSADALGLSGTIPTPGPPRPASVSSDGGPPSFRCSTRRLTSRKFTNEDRTASFKIPLEALESFKVRVGTTMGAFLSGTLGFQDELLCIIGLPSILSTGDLSTSRLAALTLAVSLGHVLGDPSIINLALRAVQF